MVNASALKPALILAPFSLQSLIIFTIAEELLKKCAPGFLFVQVVEFVKLWSSGSTWPLLLFHIYFHCASQYLPFYMAVVGHVAYNVGIYYSCPALVIATLLTFLLLLVWQKYIPMMIHPISIISASAFVVAIFLVVSQYDAVDSLLRHSIQLLDGAAYVRITLIEQLKSYALGTCSFVASAFARLLQWLLQLIQILQTTVADSDFCLRTTNSIHELLLLLANAAINFYTSIVWQFNALLSMHAAIPSNGWPTNNLSTAAI